MTRRLWFGSKWLDETTAGPFSPFFGRFDAFFTEMIIGCRGAHFLDNPILDNPNNNKGE